MYLFVMFHSMSLEHLKPQSNTINPITHNTFRHCRVHFCWTTFLETAVYIRWLEWIFQGGYPPSLNVNYVGVSRVMEKKVTTAVSYKDKTFLMIWVFLQSELPQQRNDAITFFIYLGVSLYQEFFKEIAFGSIYLP